VKQLRFAIAAAALCLAASPASAQFSNKGHDFVHAVKVRDGNKAMELLSSQPSSIINAKSEDGNTALVVAISRSDPEWTGFLMGHGADPNLAAKGGETPLMAAARVGFVDAVETLLGRGAKVDAANRMGETALIIAVQQRRIPIVRMLLDAGANPDKPDTAAGYSARDYAARDTRSREMIKMIEAKKPKASAAR
jgi:ankyrin repeat protein